MVFCEARKVIEISENIAEEGLIAESECRFIAAPLASRAWLNLCTEVRVGKDQRVQYTEPDPCFLTSERSNVEG